MVLYSSITPVSRSEALIQDVVYHHRNDEEDEEEEESAGESPFYSNFFLHKLDFTEIRVG